MVLFILAIVWAAVLVPPWLQNRSESRPNDSISSFRHQLSVLHRSNLAQQGLLPASRVASIGSGVPMTRGEARRRRGEVLMTLFAAATLTLVLALLLGGPVLILHLAVDALLVAYVALLVRTQRLATERASKVRYLPRRSEPEPATLLLRRSGS